MAIRAFDSLDQHWAKALRDESDAGWKGGFPAARKLGGMDAAISGS